jgi:hypothetical protein
MAQPNDGRFNSRSSRVHTALQFVMCHVVLSMSIPSDPIHPMHLSDMIALCIR